MRGLAYGVFVAVVRASGDGSESSPMQCAAVLGRRSP
jgi:hypothetical protein